MKNKLNRQQCEACSEPAEYSLEKGQTCGDCGNYTYYTAFYCEKHIDYYEDKDD
jgi:hypothetical protein